MLFLLLACAPAPADSAPPVDIRESSDLAVPDIGVQLTIGPLEVPAGEERYLCKVARLPNAEPLDVIALEHSASTSMHHFNIWGLLAGPEEAEGDCDELWAETSMDLASPLYASQEPYFYGEFPDGVAGQFPADQLVLIEYHVINPTQTVMIVEGTFNAWAAEPGTIETYANGIYGSIDEITLPPHEETVLSEKCYLDVDVEVFALGSHFHSRGVLFEIFGLDETGEASDLLYSNTDYESPALLLRSDDPLSISAGGGFEFRCHYQNDTDVTITAGENSDDEMCMMVAIYYPDQGFLRCRAE